MNNCQYEYCSKSEFFFALSRRCIKDSTEIDSSQIWYLPKDAGSEYDASSKTLKDLRDGQVYKTTTIGNQVWMAENLNYAYLQETNRLDSSSFLLKDKSGKLIKGRFYLKSASMDSAAVFSETGLHCGGVCPAAAKCEPCQAQEIVRGPCPKNWHVPNLEELQTLLETVGDSSAAKLKSKTGWTTSGTDDFGFSAQMDGFGNREQTFTDYGGVWYWTSTEEKPGEYGTDTYTLEIYDHSNENARAAAKFSSYAFLIRCVMD